MSGWTLKCIAIAAMLTDHIAWAFMPPDSVPGQIMHIIGRITGPIMFFMIAEGFRHTRNFSKYAARLGIFAVISQVPYIYFWTGKLPALENFFHGNVLFTLLFGLLGIQTIKKAKWPAGMLIFIGIAIVCTPCDWDLWGVIYIMLFTIFKSKIGRNAGYILLSIQRTLTLLSPFQAGTLLALPLINQYSGKRGRDCKWLFYAFYPVHLAVIGFIKWGMPV